MARPSSLTPELRERIERDIEDGIPIVRACRAAEIPKFSPHDLRHRRISLLHHQGRTWAQIGQFVGHADIATTAGTYTHVLLDGREVDHVALIADA